jgi:hypothetical protein
MDRAPVEPGKIFSTEYKTGQQTQALAPTPAEPAAIQATQAPVPITPETAPTQATRQGQEEYAKYGTGKPKRRVIKAKIIND